MPGACESGLNGATTAPQRGLSDAYSGYDVMVDLLRGYPPAIAWLESLGEAEIGLPGFVIMELIQGCRNKQEQKTLQQKIAPFEVLWRYSLPFPGLWGACFTATTRLFL